MDKWLRRIWLVNGIGILLGLVFLLGRAVIDLLPSSANPSGPISTSRALPEGADSTILQDVRPTLPLPVGRTGIVYIGLQVRDFTTRQPQSSYRIMKYSDEAGRDANFTNIVFVRKGGSSARLLLDRKALITYTDIPASDDSLRTYSLYKIAFRDTDDDGRIGVGDSTDLYVADLDGTNLSPVLPPGLAAGSFAESENRQLLYIRASVPPADSHITQEDWPEKLFVYDIKARQLHPYAEIDSSLSVAQRILWSK
jgi:hypothetical protein